MTTHRTKTVFSSENKDFAIAHVSIMLRNESEAGARIQAYASAHRDAAKHCKQRCRHHSHLGDIRLMAGERASARGSFCDLASESKKATLKSGLTA